MCHLPRARLHAVAHADLGHEAGDLPKPYVSALANLAERTKHRKKLCEKASRAKATTSGVELRSGRQVLHQSDQRINFAVLSRGRRRNIQQQKSAEIWTRKTPKSQT